MHSHWPMHRSFEDNAGMSNWNISIAMYNIIHIPQKADDFELPYNFLIGGDGQAYEIRGWNHENGLNYLPRKTSIVIGFVGKYSRHCFWKFSFIRKSSGNYNMNSPTEKQFKNAYSLIEEMRRRQLLHNNFRIFGAQNLTNSLYEGQEIIREISKWSRFSTTLKML